MTHIAPLADLDDTERVHSQIEAIFATSAATQSFASDAERAAYGEFWLGRYIRHCPESFFIAQDANDDVIGYLAGSLISNRAPLTGPDYYDSFAAALTDAYPAHIHVNVRGDCRGQSIGSALVGAFRAYCADHRCPGFHAVTAADGAAAGFFGKCGLSPRATIQWRGRHIVFMGEALARLA
jgi:GNAT superfamily N-acetyltransferase